ncbi:right-handed parallel beta-helix repeat-containing protein [Candidatus Dojkabacteria bacterium]|uniref:Probable pectate lyase C n=1 Tax=Candidatus Dojkabacteria bacterium TaxID=2099670 RepID=A0A955L168_9BACT|nr:right-handed parallel beta-helix repeat-containing protein [Candidatus Dojkabacteria bacterium]
MRNILKTDTINFSKSVRKIILFLIIPLFVIILGLIYFITKTLSPQDNEAAQNGCDIVVAKDETGNHTSIQAGVNAATSGQTICVKSGNYREQVVIKTPNLTLKGIGSENPVIDGKYDDSLFVNGQLPGPDAGGGYPDEVAVYGRTLPGKQWDALLSIEASNTVWDGIDIINSSGELFQVLENANDNVIKNSKFDFAYNSIYIIHSDRNLVENNELSRASMKYYDEKRVCNDDAVECVAGSMKIENKGGKLTGEDKYAVGNIIRGNSLRYTRSEGIAMGDWAKDTIVEDNLVVDTYHVALYATKGSQNTTFRRNMVIHTRHPDATANKEHYANGIVYGDETQNSAQRASGITVYNNIVIGSWVLFEIRNDVGTDHGYDTKLDKSYIGYNTFIAGPHTDVPIRLKDNKRGNPHTDKNIFENNIILSKWHLTANTITGGGASQKQFENVVKRNNIWSVAPVDELKGTNDIYLSETASGNKGAEVLLSPYATLPNGTWGAVWDDAVFPYNKSNYKTVSNYTPRSNSVAIGAASARSGITGVTIPSDINIDYGLKGRTDATGGKYDIGAVESNGTDPVITNTPTPINTNTPTPLITNTVSPTPIFTVTPTPSGMITITPTTIPISGNICGKADVDGDGRFNIADFAEFAKSYGMGTNTCADKDVEYGPCGGRDVNKDGKLNIADFGGQGIGFAQRYYPKTSCVIN